MVGTEADSSDPQHSAEEGAGTGAPGGGDPDLTLADIWPRETKPQLEFEVIVRGQRLPLPITQDLMGRRFEYMIGNIVWDAAVTMHKYFQEGFRAGFWSDKRVLELGSGTGLVGITLGALGAEVWATDVPAALPLLQYNIETCLPAAVIRSTRCRAPTVEPLTWGEVIPAENRREYDFVVGSDITYNKDACRGLLKTLREVCGEHTIVYIGHLERGGEENRFFNEFAEHFDVEEAYCENVAEDGVARRLLVHIYKAVKKPTTEAT